MIRLGPDQAVAVRHWFLPERPGPLVGLHILNTGHGAVYADRWPDPGALLAHCAGNIALYGDPAALDPGEMRRLLVGLVEARDSFLAPLRAALPHLRVWPRVMLRWSPDVPGPPLAGHPVRRITAADVALLDQLSGDVNWILKTWDGAVGMADSGRAWIAEMDGRIVSLACSFFVGDRYEEVGVVTEPAWRRRGLAGSCASALCRDIRLAGKTPTWTTSPDNHASMRLAQKLGFEQVRRDRLYVIGRPIPG